MDILFWPACDWPNMYVNLWYPGSLLHLRHVIRKNCAVSLLASRCRCERLTCTWTAAELPTSPDNELTTLSISLCNPILIKTVWWWWSDLTIFSWGVYNILMGPELPLHQHFHNGKMCCWKLPYESFIKPASTIVKESSSTYEKMQLSPKFQQYRHYQTIIVYIAYYTNSYALNVSPKKTSRWFNVRKSK